MRDDVLRSTDGDEDAVKLALGQCDAQRVLHGGVDFLRARVRIGFERQSSGGEDAIIDICVLGDG